MVFIYVSISLFVLLVFCHNIYESIYERFTKHQNVYYMLLAVIVYLHLKKKNPRKLLNKRGKNAPVACPCGVVWVNFGTVVVAVVPLDVVPVTL